MFYGKYKIADLIIEINSVYRDVHTYCIDYSSDEAPDITVNITEDDIAFEKTVTEREFRFEGLSSPDFSDGEYEITAVYRSIAEKINALGRIVFHGSVVAVDGEAYLFTAKSGTGKSTHTRLWREYFGDKAVMINDDKPILYITDNGVIVYGTPYNGKHRIGNNISAPLKAICILERGENNKIVKITKSQAYAMLLQQVYRPQNKTGMASTLKLIDKLAEKTELYCLECNMDISAAETAYNGMKG